MADQIQPFSLWHHHDNNILNRKKFKLVNSLLTQCQKMNNCYLWQTNWLWSGLRYILVHFYKYMELVFNKLKNISPSNVHMFLEVYDT